jgi:hypothetical protein
MILGDLLGTPVYASDGTRLGRLADARFVTDGSHHQLMADAHLMGMVVSPHSASSFLGYEQTALTSPGPSPGCSGGGTADHSSSCGPTSPNWGQDPCACGKDSPPTTRCWTTPGRTSRPAHRCGNTPTHRNRAHPPWPACGRMGSGSAHA